MISSQSTVRRLLKARREEMATISITARPRTIFDSQDVTAPYTQYVVKLRSSSTSSSQSPKEGWKLRKRYSDFYALHQELRRTRRQWEISCLKQGEAFQPVIKVLQRAAGPEFPRKHVRCDTSAIIHERRQQLMEYTRTLLAAYVELEVLLGAPGLLKDNFVDEIVCVNTVFVEIERFLEIPPKRKEIEAQLTRAVMTLEEVKSDPNGVRPSQCCICLNDSGLSGDSDADTNTEMAQLPCAHIFHEDCIIHWLQCSSTCPMCRRTVGKAAKRRSTQLSTGDKVALFTGSCSGSPTATKASITDTVHVVQSESNSRIDKRREARSLSVEVGEGETVYDLKEAIAGKQEFDFEASKLQLFLAKIPKDKHGEVECTEGVKEEVPEDMAWLSSRSEDAKKLKKGKNTPFIEVLTEEDQELQAEYPLEDVLSGVDPPSSRQIHVLVMVPPQDDLRSPVTTLLEVLLHHVLTQAPTTLTDRNVDFKDELCNFYGCYSPEQSCLRCMLLNVAFPSSLVVASHLFRRSNEDVLDVMMQISDIDDVRNGLLLFKPLKHAFDHFQLSFIRDDTGAFCLKVFDPSVLGTPLIDLEDRNGDKVFSMEETQLLLNRISSSKNPCHFNAQTTFGDVDGSAVTFTGLERLFYRCLNLQASVARIIALEKKWIDASYDFQDYWSEVSLDDKMEMFHRSILNSVAPF